MWTSRWATGGPVIILMATRPTNSKATERCQMSYGMCYVTYDVYIIGISYIQLMFNYIMIWYDIILIISYHIYSFFHHNWILTIHIILFCLVFHEISRNPGDRDDDRRPLPFPLGGARAGPWQRWAKTCGKTQNKAFHTISKTRHYCWVLSFSTLANFEAYKLAWTNHLSYS